MSERPADETLIQPDCAPDLDDLFCAAYAELRRLASAVRRREHTPTLNPTALVNEAWLKLAGSPPVGSLSPLHFKRIAARAMRQVLVEAARRRHAGKRAGGHAVTFDEALVPAREGAADILALDTALEELARLQPRQAKLVELRFFGGLEVGEVARALDISEATALRDWRAARAWLARRLRAAP
ncbi:MAG: RNA polymerase subunit sigma-70 [Acidobacteria bacterium]|nr:RNA polymerase subunit sigma-70 [Acidobacteriota bacterium]